MSIRIYGIRNCDTMKKAFSWFEETGHAYTFHDYKKHGVDESTLTRWCETVGWKRLLNRRGTTWRRLSPEQQAVETRAQAIALMRQNTSLIRRPVIEGGDDMLIVGFDSERLKRLYGKSAEAGK